VEPALYDRAIELLREGCPESRDVVRLGGASRVYELDKPSCVSFLLQADRDLVTKAQAEAAGVALVGAVTRAEPALADRLRWSTCPDAKDAAINAQGPIDAAHELLARHLTEHEADCPEHRETPGYLFLAEVEANIGWSPSDDHLLAWFCVDGSGPTARDEACCANAVAALKAKMPELADVLRWQCTPYR